MATCRVRRSHCCDLLPSEPCVRVAPHTAQASAAGKRSPAARSIRSWFRLTGSFRHPSFGLFSLRCLTSPSVEASSLIAPLRPAGSLRPFGLGLSSLPRPCLRHYSGAFAFSGILYPLRHYLSLRSSFHLSAGRMGLTLLSDLEKRMGRLRPIVRQGLMSPSSVLATDDPPRVPFWLRPVSTFGRLPITDLDNGRSLAFSLPSSAGPPPDWCSQIVAVVPGASHVGLLLRMSG